MALVDPVYTLSDLRTWSGRGISLAVLGHPIGHSLSPPMHNAALAELARGDPAYADWKYHRFDVPPEHLPEALELLAARGFRGVNLTVPHKVIAFGLVQDIDPAARPVGAVNTLLRTGTGWKGFNTDGYGLATAVREALGFGLEGCPVVLLGAGGAARGAAVECVRRGCSQLAIFNRTASNAEALLGVLRPLAKGIPISHSRGDAPPDTLVVNATSAGLKDSDPAPLDLATIPRPRGVYDMIYNPPRTALLRAADAIGVPAANGLSMLVHQGAKALEIWTGVPAAQTAPAMAAAVQGAGNH